MGKTEKIVLTPKQERWLTNHFKHTQNSECAEEVRYLSSFSGQACTSDGAYKKPSVHGQVSTRNRRGCENLPPT